MNNTNEKSNLAYIIEWLLSDTYEAFDLIVRDATSTNTDILLRSEVATALWARALFKLSTFTDYITNLADLRGKDRGRVVTLFNLEASTVIPHCGLKEIPVNDLLRNIRHELSHGAEGNSVAPLRRMIVDNGVAYVQCRKLSGNESCNICGVFTCDRSTITAGGDVCCKVSISNVMDAVTNGLKTWSEMHRIELEKAVEERRKLLIPSCDKKSNNTIPWWFEQCDELWAFRL